MTEKTAAVAEGGCLCGSVRYRINAPLREVVICHCSQCRRTHGHFSAYTAVESDGLELSCPDGLKWYRSSELAERGFCCRCGASLFWKPAERGYVSVAAGTLDPPTNLHTAAHIYCSDAGDYYQISDNLPHHPGSLNPTDGG